MNIFSYITIEKSLINVTVQSKPLFQTEKRGRNYVNNLNISYWRLKLYELYFLNANNKIFSAKIHLKVYNRFTVIHKMIVFQDVSESLNGLLFCV